jgi:CYTH domain-containing protein
MEIERSFLLARDPPGVAQRVERIDQGYLAAGPDGAEVRIRRRGEVLTLTIKSLDPGAARLEEELTIDALAFERLWPLTQRRRLQKDRHVFALAGGLHAEVDVYRGSLTGLRVVEVEFPSPQAAAAFSAPGWFGREVTDDPRYRNRALALAARAPD